MPLGSPDPGKATPRAATREPGDLPGAVVHRLAGVRQTNGFSRETTVKGPRDGPRRTRGFFQACGFVADRRAGRSTGEDEDMIRTFLSSTALSTALATALMASAAMADEQKAPEADVAGKVGANGVAELVV